MQAIAITVIYWIYQIGHYLLVKTVPTRKQQRKHMMIQLPTNIKSY